MVFTALNDEGEARIAEALARTTYEGSEFSVLYRKGWSFYNYPSMQYAVSDGAVFLRFLPADTQVYPCGDYLYLPPLAPVSEIANAVRALEQYCKDNELPLTFIALPQEYIDVMDTQGYEISDNRDYDEYLYAPDDLMNLPGKKYHSKRNFVKRFVNAYEGRYEFRSFDCSDCEGLMQLYSLWSKGKEDEKTVKEEIKLLRLGVEFVKTGRAFADVMTVDGKVTGFALGEVIASGVAIVHIEKGDTAYEGIYPALNQMFSLKHFSQVRYVNRQEDLGIEGLRKAKESYKPVKMVRKYVARKLG